MLDLSTPPDYSLLKKERKKLVDGISKTPAHMQRRVM
jgi:hypothetical protein